MVIAPAVAVVAAAAVAFPPPPPPPPPPPSQFSSLFIHCSVLHRFNLFILLFSFSDITKYQKIYKVYING